MLTGAMELMRILLGAHSMAILFIKFSTPALAAPVWLWGEGGRDLLRGGRDGRGGGG